MEHDQAAGCLRYFRSVKFVSSPHRFDDGYFTPQKHEKMRVLFIKAVIRISKSDADLELIHALWDKEIAKPKEQLIVKSSVHSSTA